MASEQVQVVIIGAGLSGLCAAREVHKAGLSYVVLEAMDHVGGKILSLPVNEGGAVVDMGAAWINDTSQSEIYRLAREFGFDLVQQRTGGINLHKDAEGELHRIPYGKIANLEPEQLAQIEQVLRSIAECAEKCDTNDPSKSPDAAEIDAMNVQEFIDGKFGEEASFLAPYITRHLLGVEPCEVSALFLLDIFKRGTGLENVLSDFKDGGQYLRNRQGKHLLSFLHTFNHRNQAFCTRLADQLKPGSIKVSAAVESITQSSKGCIVKASDGSTCEAQKVILSVPAGLQHTIKFDPDLPPARKQLGQGSVFGFYSKTVLVYEEPWWHAADLSGEYSADTGPISFARDTCVSEDGQYSITCFHAGDSGREWSRLSAEERRKTVLEDLNAAFGKVVPNVPQPINIVEKDWLKDPWALGGPGPVLKPGILTSNAGKYMCEPFDNIYFVGTETSPVWRGYMDGAVRSGMRGGKEVVAAIKRS
ncbi:hypothetical protein CP533_2025 [Ophiocordyceps camponoti-saundersi (nom. inval.)]|nr:hypothetical protein CP533_2025 [Ophiocordyceps camponoti-saundersi (nom. inval.)]